MRYVPAIIATLSLLACADAGDDANADPTSMPAISETRFYVGSTDASLADGTPLSNGAITMRRRVDPASGEIRETTTRRSAEGDVVKLKVVYSVVGDELSAVFSDAYGEMELEGSLQGDPWMWTAWSWEAVYADGPYVGSRLVTEATLGQGTLAMIQEVRSPVDHLEALIDDVYDEVDEAAYDEANAGL